jgi:membrane protease YdiL (CAAX protease family)
MTTSETSGASPDSNPDPVRDVDVVSPGGPGRGLDLLTTGLAWIAILVAAWLWMAKPAILDDLEAEGGEDAVPAGMLVGPQDELAGRLALGFDRLFPDLGGPDQAGPLAAGSTAQRVAHAILTAAISGPEAASDELDRLESDPVAELLVPGATRAIEAMTDGSPVSDRTRDELEDRLGWFGTLAGELDDPDAIAGMAADAESALYWMAGLFAIFAIALIAGFIGLVVLIVKVAMDGTRFRIPVVERHGLYAETFAIWLFGMLVLQIAAGFVATESTAMIASVLAFFASLSVLAWPVIRGRAWSDVRTDLGLIRPRLADLPLGVATWSMAMPILLVGFIATIVLLVVSQFLSGEAPQPSHPVTEAAIGAGTWQIVQLFLLASVAAPIVEETFFRGVLLTHLRSATGRWNQWLSFGLAAVVSSLLFAAIHPQGLIFIPPLAGLAVGFCVGRAWQGSLVPSMVAHGVSNALIMSLNVILFA